MLDKIKNIFKKKLSDKEYLEMGYKYKYHDMNGRSVYYFPHNTTKEEYETINSVLNEFGHLKYFFCTNLLLNKTKKISRNKLTRKISKYFRKKLINFDDDTLDNKEIDKLLNNYTCPIKK